MNQQEIPTSNLEGAVEFVPQRSFLKRVGFYVLNTFLIFHLIAICASPISVSPASPLEQSLWESISPYVQVLYQNNGFHFFAPNPEGCNTVHYTLHYEDGSSERGKFPHRGIFPRLLYHRHLMLSEFLGASQGKQRELLIHDFAYQVCKAHQADSITLSLVWHDLALRERIIAGGTLFDDDLYQETPLGTFTWAELSASSSENSVATATE